MKKILVVGIILLFLGSSITSFAHLESNNQLLRLKTKSVSLGYTIKLSGKMGYDGFYVGPVTITITGLTNETVFYKLNGGNYTLFIPPSLTVGADGNYSFEALVVDQYGNQTYLGPVNFHIDQTPPVIVDFNIDTHHGLKIVGDAYDNYSGLDHWEIWTGSYNILPWPYDFNNPFGVQPFGLYLYPRPYPHINTSYTVIIYDRAGNTCNQTKTASLNLNQQSQQSHSNPLQSQQRMSQQRSQDFQSLLNFHQSGQWLRNFLLHYHVIVMR